jgi:hypothetical protein
MYYGKTGLKFVSFLYNRLADSDEFVNCSRRPLYTHTKIPDTHFCYKTSHLKDPMIPSEIELPTFRFVAQCLKQLLYRMLNRNLQNEKMKKDLKCKRISSRARGSETICRQKVLIRDL